MTNCTFTEERLSYMYEQNRLTSFTTWPFKDSSNCSKKKMAEAGFFWIGTVSEPDVAQCFLCNKQLDGWESTDDPWSEHMKHSENCLFVIFKKPELQLTVYQFYDLFEAMLLKLLEKKKEEFEKEFKMKNDKYISLFEKMLKEG